MLKMRGAGVFPASDVHLLNPCLSPVSRCETCSLIPSWVMTYRTMHWCPICSLVWLAPHFRVTFFSLQTEKTQNTKLNFKDKFSTNFLPFFQRDIFFLVLLSMWNEKGLIFQALNFLFVTKVQCYLIPLVQPLIKEKLYIL